MLSAAQRGSPRHSASCFVDLFSLAQGIPRQASVPPRRVRRCARPGLAGFTYHRPGRTFLPAARTNARNGGEGASGRLRYSGWPWLGLGLGLALLTLTLTPNPNPNLEAEVERVVEALRVELDDLGTEAALVPAGEGEG